MRGISKPNYLDDFNKKSADRWTALLRWTVHIEKYSFMINIDRDNTSQDISSFGVKYERKTLPGRWWGVQDEDA